MTLHTTTRRPWSLLLLSLAMVLFGGALGAATQTSFGAVAVSDITIAGTGGALLARLVVPFLAAVLLGFGALRARRTSRPTAVEA